MDKHSVQIISYSLRQELVKFIQHLVRQARYCKILPYSCLGNNFAKGFLTEGVEMLEPTFDAIRREVEASECLQAGYPP